jgi:hypothetical protein
MKGFSLLKPLDRTCNQYIHNPRCSWIWLQQTILGAVHNLPVGIVEPQTSSSIPSSTLFCSSAKNSLFGSCEACGGIS